MTMPGDPQLMIVIALIAAALIGLVAFRLMMSGADRHERDRKRRLTALHKIHPEVDIRPVLKRHTPAEGLHRWPLIARLARQMRQAGLSVAVERFLALCVGAGGLVFLVAVQLCAAPTALVVALAICLGLPVGAVNIARRRRLEAFTRQLPDALELMMRGLRVGHPLSATIANVGRTMSDPLGMEFRKMADQISYGEDMTKAFRDLADRVDQEDMHYLSVSVSIQHSTGGNLANMLSVLSKVIRDRLMMRRRVRAVSSEGRISATLLSCLPVVIYVATSLTAPDYYAGVSDDPKFMPIVVIIVALVVANFLALRKLSSFRF